MTNTAPTIMILCIDIKSPQTVRHPSNRTDFLQNIIKNGEELFTTNQVSNTNPLNHEKTTLKGVKLGSRNYRFVMYTCNNYYRHPLTIFVLFPITSNCVILSFVISQLNFRDFSKTHPFSNFLSKNHT